MGKLYERVNWEDKPSTKTPKSAANFNKMDKGIDDLDNKLVEQEAEMESLASQVEQIANNQIPEEYLKASVDAYIDEKGAGLATDEDLVAIDTKIDEVNSSLSGEIADVENEIYKTEKEIELKGAIYIKGGFYKDGILNTSSSTLAMYYDVSNFERVKAHIVSKEYYDVYTFVDKDFVAIKWQSEDGEPGTYDLDLEIPGGAKYLVCNGGVFDNNIVNGVTKTFENIVSWDITEIVTKQGFWHVNDYLAYSTGYSFKIYDVSLYDTVKVASKAFEFSIPIVYLDENMERLTDLESFDTNGFYHYENGYEVTLNVSDVKYIGISTQSDTSVKAYGDVSKEKMEYLENSKAMRNIVWFGTSIPAGGGSNSYPNLVGKKLKANVINEAVGSSAVTCKSPDRVSESNPYGFTHDFEGASRCLTNTIEEMQWVIEHYNDTSVFDYRTVSSLSDEDKAFILSCSYENKLLPYLTEANEPDLFVFDHGHNDMPNDTKESYYTETVDLVGSEEKGWYSNGALQTTSANACVRFDVSAYSQVILNATIGAWYDIYDLFDSDGNYLRSKKNNSGVATEIVNKEIDVTGAKYIVISASNSYLNTVEVKALKYDKNNNLYCYQGAMRFLLNKIFSFNPKARVICIGEYENEKHPNIAKYQEMVANEWDLPIYRQWEFYGWSSNTVKTLWYWNNGVWTKGSTEQTITILDCWLADGVHPHSDTTGKTVEFMAKHIAKWIKENIDFLY